MEEISVTRKKDEKDMNSITENICKNINNQILIYKEQYEREKNNEEKVTDDKINSLLATMLGVKTNTVYRYRSGEIKQPSLPIIIKLAEILNCSIDELVTGKKDHQEYLSKLENKGFTPNAIEIINKRLKASIYNSLFKMGVPEIRIDFFTVLSYLIEQEKFVDTVILESQHIIEEIQSCGNYDKYYKTIKDIVEGNIISNKTNYEQFVEKISDDVKLEIKKYEININKMFELYKKEYLFYMFYQLYIEWNDNKDKI